MSPRVPRQGLALAAVLALFTAVPAADASHGTSHHLKKHHPKVRAASADWDHDGLINLYERRSHTNPRAADTDGDGVKDGLEDRDGDGVNNRTEQLALTRPGKVDSDRDGTPDGAEDPDQDGLNNAGESAAGTQPRKADTDGDGIKDGDENMGTISAVDGPTVTIARFGGGSLTAVIDSEWTDIYSTCAADDDFDDPDAGDDDPAVDDGDSLSDDAGDDSLSDDAGDDDADDPAGDDGDASGDDDDFGDERSASLPSGGTCVVPGARVYEADVETKAGTVTFTALDLLGG